MYTARELPSDPSISALIAQHSESVHDPRVHQVAVDAMGPVLDEGQRSGEVRTDIGIDEMVDFLVETRHLIDLFLELDLIARNLNVALDINKNLSIRDPLGGSDAVNDDLTFIGLGHGKCRARPAQAHW